MEPQDCYYDRKPAKRKNCLCLIASIILTAFGVVIGVIIGANISAAVLAALPAVIVLAVVLGFLLLLTLIYQICKKERKC